MSDDTATIIECYGRRVVLALPDGERRHAEVFGKRLKVVCGDHVRITLGSGNDAVQVTEVLPRKTVLARTDSRGQAEFLVANLTQLIVLLSEQPASDPFIVDRYLASAELSGIRALVAATKLDLGHSDAMQQLMKDYEAAGYQVVAVSARDAQGLAPLRVVMKDQISMLVGESGVGKSTLTNALLGRSTQPTRELSEATGEGRHTTVSSAMFALADGGALIDSPGVRDYAPPPVADSQVMFGWREFAPYSGACKFNNCLHLREPGCAIIQAVTAGKINARRYESYKRLLNLMRQLLPDYERR